MIYSTITYIGHCKINTSTALLLKTVPSIEARQWSLALQIRSIFFSIFRILQRQIRPNTNPNPYPRLHPYMSCFTPVAIKTIQTFENLVEIIVTVADLEERYCNIK